MIINRSGVNIPVKITSLGQDWKSDHRPLPDNARSAALAYIEVIAQRLHAKIDDENYVERSKIELWQHFRNNYDELAGAYRRSDTEDSRRAMARI